MGQKGAWPRSLDLLFKFFDPLIYICGMAENTKLIFCKQIEVRYT